LVPLVAADGTLVVNRHRRGDAGSLVRMLRRRFDSVRTQRVRREGENVLIYAFASPHRLIEERPGSPGRDERWGAWGAISGPPTFIDPCFG